MALKAYAPAATHIRGWVGALQVIHGINPACPPPCFCGIAAPRDESCVAVVCDRRMLPAQQVFLLKSSDGHRLAATGPRSPPQRNHEALSCQPWLRRPQDLGHQDKRMGTMVSHRQRVLPRRDLFRVERQYMDRPRIHAAQVLLTGAGAGCIDAARITDECRTAAWDVAGKVNETIVAALYERR